MKKITAIFTVLMLLVSASAFAAVTVEAPAGLVNSTKMFTGFMANATAKKYVLNNELTNATMFVYNSSTDGFYSNGTSVAGATNTLEIIDHTRTATNGNCTYSIWNGTDWQKRVIISKNSNEASRLADYRWKLNQAMGNIQGMTTLGRYNGTNATTFFINTGGHAFMVGIANATTNASKVAALNVAIKGQGQGVTTSVLFDNGTFTDSVYSSTWDYYAYGFDTTTALPGYVAGKIVLGESGKADNAVATYTVVEAGSKANVADAEYTVTTARNDNYVQILKSGSEDLLTNGTVNKDRNLITGYAIHDDGDKLFVVMVKSGTTLSSSDLTKRSFKLLFAGTSDNSVNFGKATGAIAAFSVDSNLGIDGYLDRFNATRKLAVASNLVETSLSGYSVALADSDYFNVKQSNMTIYSTDGKTVVGQFYGKQTADKTMCVGIYESEETGIQGYNIAFLIPNPAVTSAIGAAGVGYQNNKTLATNGLHGLDLNSTAYSQVALRTQWSGIPSDFTPLTDVKGFNATITEKQKHDVYFTFQFKFTGVGDSINHLRLYKVFPTAAKTVREYNYAGSATPAAEGSWWISTDVADGYLNENSVLAPATEYYVNYVVKSNGEYDYKSSDKQQIGDPIVFGSVPSSSSSSSSGCVFNPAAGFGLEWLLLMLAPMVAIVRSRFK